MRVATWNLERGGRRRATAGRQLAVLDQLDTSLMVVTEPPSVLTAVPGRSVTSPPARSGRYGPEAWVAIVGPGVEPVGETLPYERLAAAARAEIDGRPVIVYASVLPWRAILSHLPGIARPRDTPAAVFARVLHDQVHDIESLRHAHPDVLVIWAGDFNQSLEGPNLTGTNTGRASLAAALDHLGLHAWNRQAPHARPGMCAIDLICTPRTLKVKAVHQIGPVVDGTRLSDHAGYLLDIEWP